jgi:tRNA nucleotidyltransferase (CCA-adding enzyme)
MFVPEAAINICKELRSNGYEAWLVGGAVRDSLMGREAHDWDIATNALPEQTTAIFSRVVDIGDKHGTVSVIIDSIPYEVTTYRTEGSYSDGRHPDSVEFVSNLEQDLERRDFTINAIAFDPITNQFDDPFGGITDIANLIIRAVGDPEKRFNEDGLRILRFCRFIATHNLKSNPETLAAVINCLDNLKGLSEERIQQEWFKTMKADKPSSAFSLMIHLGILNSIVPEFSDTLWCAQNKYHAYTVWEHTMRVMDNVPKDDTVLRFAGLFHDIAKPATKGIHPVTGDVTFYNHEEIGAEMTETILQRLKFSNDDRHRIVHHVRHHLIPYEEGWSAAAIRRWVRKVGTDNVKTICQLGRADIAGKGTDWAVGRYETLDNLEKRISEMTINTPIATSTNMLAINGNDVMTELGIGPSKAVGDKLKELLEHVTEHPEDNNRETLISILKG